MHNNITSDYKKVNNDCLSNINHEAKSITDKLKISDRVEKLALKEAYITVKDHKPEFPNVTKCRLINPTKSQIGRISKQILDNINVQLIDKLNLRLLKNTDETILWFKSIEQKTRKSFIQLDIVNYYPSVTEALLDRVLDFAAENVTITNEQRKIIKNARKSILFHNKETWQKNVGRV